MVLNRRLLFCLLIALVLTGRSASAEASDYVRLHVVAASDAAPDQALKLEVRDAVLMEARRMLARCPDAEAAWDIVNAGLDRLGGAATARARELGWTGPVRCEAGVFGFPDRVYGGRLVPAGRYRAVRVVIGEGRGRNWWCVLYPSLCWFGEPPEQAPFRSAIRDWLSRLFGGEPA